MYHRTLAVPAKDGSRAVHSQDAEKGPDARRHRELIELAFVFHVDSVHRNLELFRGRRDAQRTFTLYIAKL